MARRNWRSCLRWVHYSHGVSMLLANEQLVGGVTLHDGRWNNWIVGCQAAGVDLKRGTAMRKLRRRVVRIVDACLEAKRG